MTTASAGSLDGLLSVVAAESPGDRDELEVVLQPVRGRIFEDLRTGTDVASSGPLKSNVGLASRGVTLVGQGFLVPDEQLHLSSDAGRFLKPYLTGRALSQGASSKWVLDFYGLDENEVRSSAPYAYQWLLDRVKPERDENNRQSYRDRWWVFAEPRSSFRKAAANLSKIIVTPRTAKHRFFQFAEPGLQFESEVVGIALEDPTLLGVLCTSVHMAWVEANAASFGAYVGNIRYNQTRCFDPFPFPDLHAADKFAGPIGVAPVDENGRTGKTETFGECPSDRIRTLAEQLDAHRKRQQAAHPGLTLTGMYNVLEKLRSGEPLTAKERTIHEQSLVSVLRQLHDELDEAVLHAYGWDDVLPLLRIAHGNDAPPEGQGRDDARRAFDEAILERLVALNAERAAAEARGEIHWLRPEFQNPEAHREPEQRGLDTTPDEGERTEPTSATPIATKPMPWPKDTVAQVRAVADVLAASPVPLSIDEIAARFTARGPWKKRLPKLLEMLVALGRALEQDGGYVVA